MFRSKFSPKKGPTRKYPSMSNLQFDDNGKAIEFGVEMNGPVKLNLGGREMIFADGTWISESQAPSCNDPSYKELDSVKETNLRVSEENNLLKIKVELLMDMLSEKTAEVHLMENELEKMKKYDRKR